MENHLDHRVRLSTSSEFTSLYNWCIQEFDANNKKLGRDQVPWDWSLYFVAKNLKHTLNTKYKTEEFGKYPGTSKVVISSDELISTALEPLIEKRRASHYSMFGTARQISKFDLRISKGISNQEEMCRIYGGISYTGEWDFENVTSPDYIQIEVILSVERFNEIKEAIALQADKTCVLYLKGVRGFYSEWSPSIRTNSIKILANPKVQGLEIPQDSIVDYPVLGEVEEFQLVLTNEKQMTAPVNQDRDDDLPQGDFHASRIVSETQQLSGVDPIYRKSMLRAAQATAIAVWVLVSVLLLRSKF